MSKKMKNTNNLLKGTALFCASLLLLVSCQKEDSSLSDVNPQTTSQTRTSGLVQDDPIKVGKVPFTISESYFEAQANLVSGNVYGANVPSFTGRIRSDRTAPTVSITSPANSASVSGTVSITASASDNVGVSVVTFFVDNVSIGTKTTAPYTASWNSTGAATGSHVIKVTAQDAAGNLSTASIQVGINTTSTGDIAPPSVTITSPTSASSFTVGNNISVGVTASDNTGVAYVRLLVDGVSQGMDYTAPYSFSISTANMSSSTHTITATAYDGYNNTASASVLIALNAVILPPPPVLPSTSILIMPPVQNQGGEGSCVVFATAYGARSAEQFYKTNSTSYSYNSNVVSPEYVYNQVKATSDCGSGTTVTAALDLLVNQGACTWQSMPYSSSNGCSTMPSNTQMSEANLYKIASYSKIATSDIATMKSMIVNKHPLIIGIVTDNSFLSAGPGFIWRTQTGTSVGHALSICGFDDSKHAYKVFNSWGTSWGDAGYSWIDYDLLPIVGSYYTYVIQN
jgi:hypothetical protein